MGRRLFKPPFSGYFPVILFTYQIPYHYKFASGKMIAVKSLAV
jgi:hypothetical protein